MRRVAALLLVLVVVLLLRSTALSALGSRGIVLDVLALATTFWALRYGEASATTFGFVLGLAADLDAAHWLGRHALMLSVLGYAIGRFSHTLVRDSVRTHLALLVPATIVHQLWITAFELQGAGSWVYLLQRVALAALCTAPIGAGLFAFLRRMTGRSIFGHASFQQGSSA